MTRIIGVKKMKESLYRESRVAQVLGEPCKYSIVILLLEQGPLNVTEISRKTRRSQPTISHHLSKLRKLEIVRYETKPNEVCYWVKYSRELSTIIKALRAFVRKSRYYREDDG
jgi:DNA-binding transcriptional ArsR family regulator